MEDEALDVDPKNELIEFTVDIVSAYVSNNIIPSTDVPDLIMQIHLSLSSIQNDKQVNSTEPLVPAISVRKSITPDYLICLEDGKKFKSLKRHLRTQYGITPDEYREKWGLPPDYPMVAPNYAKARSYLAKQMGLGQAAAAKRNSRRKRSK